MFLSVNGRRRGDLALEESGPAGRSLGVGAGTQTLETVGRPAFGDEHGEVEDPLLKRALLRLVPAGARRRALLGAVRAARHRGDLVECPCCDATFSRFLPHRGRDHAKCPRCGSLERHRLLWLFLERETDLFDGGRSLLHIAPEYAFLRRLWRTGGLRYVTGDLDSALADVELDAMDLPFASESFDSLICNHVLEHVEDDRRALAEIHRVLRPGGWAVLMCPVDRRRATTLEDPAVRAPADRHRVFGQSDHVRLYGRDYADRLAAAGFAVRVDRYLDGFAEHSIVRLGLRREADEAFGDERIYICRKARGLG
jgi:SAM-dependent methyltransferase